MSGSRRLDQAFGEFTTPSGQKRSRNEAFAERADLHMVNHEGSAAEFAQLAANVVTLWGIGFHQLGRKIQTAHHSTLCGGRKRETFGRAFAQRHFNVQQALTRGAMKGFFKHTILVAKQFCAGSQRFGHA